MIPFLAQLILLHLFCSLSDVATINGSVSFGNYYFSLKEFILGFDSEMKDEFVKMESPCHAGLWQVCCPESAFKEANTDIGSLSTDFECKSLFDIEKMKIEPFANRNSFFEGQLWPIRALMLAASIMPLVAAGSRKF